MKTLIKKYLKRVKLNKLILLTAVSLLVVPSTLKAQPETYWSDQGALVGTSDSRMFITIDETEDRVEFKVSLLGELTARSLNFILLYDTAKLRLTDETYLYDIPNGFDTKDYGSPVVTIPESFSSQYPEHFMTARRHRAIYSGDASGMKYFISEMINFLPASAPIYLQPGEVIHTYSIHCRKVNPGTPITHSDIGYYAQVQEVAHEPLPVQAPYWTYDATAVRFADGMPATLFKTKPELFTYRSPSYVITEKVTQISAEVATLNATFTRGDLTPKNDMIVTGFVAAKYYGRLTWDAIAKCGFIYSTTDAEILVNGYSKKLNIDGADYDFPNATEIAIGKFIRNGKTFHITQTNNTSTDQTVSYSQTVTELTKGETYFVWSFIQYIIETSDPYLNVGSKTMFKVDCEVTPVVFAENLIYCSGEEVPEYTFEGTENTTFHWERIVGYDFGLDATAGINTIPAFVAQNYGFEYASAVYQVTPVDESGCSGETQQFLITVNPQPVTSPVEDMVYCNGETAPRFDFSSDMPNVLFAYEFVNEQGSTMIPGVPASGENFIPGFPAYNTGNEPVTGKYRVKASYTFNNHTCYDDTWQYFNIVILPTPTVIVTPADQVINSGETISDIVFSGNVTEVVYQWTRTEGNIPEIPSSGEGNITGMPIYNTGLLPISATYSVVAVLNNEDYPGYNCTGASAQFTITVNPTVDPDTVLSFVYCNGETAPVYTFTGSSPLAVYTWEFVSGAVLEGVPTSGRVIFPSFVAINTGNTPIVAIYRVRANYSNYSSEWSLFTVTVLPTPNVVSTPVHQTVCSEETTVPVVFTGNVTNVTYQWSRVSGNIPALPLSGAGDFESYTITNTGSVIMEAVYEVTPVLNYSEYPGYTCAGNSTQFSIAVMPQLHINTIPAMVYCNGEQTQSFEFGNTSGVLYTWKLTNGANVGLAEHGTGRLPSFIAVNNSNGKVLEATYEVTASVSMYDHECTHSVSFTIVVNPTPSVNLNIEPYYFCAGVETPEIDLPELFESLNNHDEMIYEWYYISDNYIGLDIESGINIIPSFIAVNNTNQQIAGTFKVKARFDKCISEEKTFKIIVNPAPGVVHHTNTGSICSGSLFEYMLIPNVTVDKISWIRMPHPDINHNEGASGNNNYIGEILNNTSDSNITVTYLITLVAGECSYENIAEVEVIVIPSIEFNIHPITTVCNNESFVTLTYDVNISGAQYTLLFGQEGNAAGFVSVPDYMPLPDNGITVNMPQGVNQGNYPASITIKSGKCTKTDDIIITVKGAPVASDISNAKSAFCDNDEMYLFVTVEGNVQYQWYFNGDILQGETASYYETIFDSAKEGEYAVEISNECGKVIYTFTVIQTPAMIKMKWDDVMYVANSEETYMSYQWYKNGKPIAKNGNDQYYSESGGFTPGATYSVRAFKADGTYDEACPFIPNLSCNTGYGFTVYPNPSQIGSKITFLLRLPDYEDVDANACIFDMTGKMVTQLRITNYLTEVTLNIAAGIYVVKVNAKNGNEFVEKIIIQK